MRYLGALKKRIIMFKSLFTLAIAAMLLSNTTNERLQIGDAAPLTDYKMLDVSGKSFSLADLKGDKGLLVIFSCNTCPFVLGWEDQYPMLGYNAKMSDIGMVLVNSNEAKRSGEDSMAEMKKHYNEGEYNTPYVIDENAKLADAFGANTTPHVFLFDGDMKLVYTGSINDKYEQKSKIATTRWLVDAMMNLADGNAAGISPNETKNIGCSIKRK